MVIEGSGGGGKGTGASASTPRESPDSLRSKSIARFVDLLCEGEIQGLHNGLQGVFLNDVALQNSDGTYNYEDVILENRVGLPDQDYIPGFSNIETEIGVNQVVLKPAPVLFTVTNTDLDRVILKLTFRSLSELLDNGDLVGSIVQFDIEVRDGASANFERPVRRQQISGKTTSPYQLSFDIMLTGPAPWTFRVTRITDDADSVRVSNEFLVASYTEVIDGKFFYPDSALVAMEVDSQIFSGSIPRRSYLIDGLKIQVPSNYNPVTRTYSGLWDGTFKLAFSNNPAWVFYDILVNSRYGLGDFIDAPSIDKFALFPIGQYCDELVSDGMGGQEPRFVCNAILQTRQQAFAVINQLASVFRGLAYWSAGGVTATQDSPKDPTRVVNQADVINGIFNYEGSALKARHTVAHVTWNDPEDNYRPAIEVVEDQLGIIERGYRPVDVTAFATTTRGQAIRTGRWILDSERFETQTVTYTAGLDHADVRPGEIIAIHDPSIAGARLGGRIQGIEDSALAIDQSYDAQPSDILMLMLQDGSVDEIPILGNGDSDTVLILARTPTPLPVAGAVFAIVRTDLAPTLWRVISNSESEKNLHEIVALQYDQNKFTRVEDGVVIDPPPTSQLPTGQLIGPTDLTVVESLTKVNNKIRTRMTISWQPSIDPRVTLYRLETKPPSGEWFIVQVSPQTSLDIFDGEAGVWSFAVTSLSGGGTTGDGSPRIALNDVTIQGKTAPPSDVQNLTAVRRVDGIGLSWDRVTDLDLVGYDVRLGVDWDTAEIITEQNISTQIFIPIDISTPVTFLVRARDELDILSLGIASIETSVTAPLNVRDFQVVSQGASILARWEAVPGSGIEYEVRSFRGSPPDPTTLWGVGQFLGRSSATELTTLFPVRDQGNTTFLCKAISRAGLFSADAVFFSLGTAPIENRNEILFRNEQTLNFPGLKNSLEFDTDSNNLFLALTTQDIPILRGEYIAEINLPRSIRARNWIEIDTVFRTALSLDWQNASFPWNSVQANVPWTPPLDIDNAQVIPYLAEELTATPPSVLEGWTLDNTLVGMVQSTPPVNQQNVAYGQSRYRNGLIIDPLTKVDWNFNVPNEFSVLFTVLHRTLNNINREIYLTLEAPGGTLVLGHDPSTMLTFLEDNFGNKLTVNALRVENTFSLFAIVQSETERSLFVHETETDEIRTASAPYTPLTGLNNIALGIK